MLFLNDDVADFNLLQFPTNSTFDYSSLLAFCNDNQGKEELCFRDWVSLSSFRFGFGLDQAELYFESFAMFSASNQDGVKISSFLERSLPLLPFVLFLYNQLFNLSGSLTNRVDAEFPSVKEEPHDPLGSLIYQHSSRTSISSIEELEADDLQSLKSFPSAIVDRRYKLAAFWRYTSCLTR